jgi:hypothetical protein
MHDSKTESDQATAEPEASAGGGQAAVIDDEWRKML